VATLQLSLLSLNNILTYDPSVNDYKIVDINKSLSHLFTLARTTARPIDDAEKIQHTINVYLRIRQPEPWAQWCRNQSDLFDNGALTNSQNFMNQAVMKYNKIVSAQGGKFNGSSTTIQEDIVAMVSDTVKKAKRKTPAAATEDDSKPPATKHKLPPFAKQPAVSTAANAQKYKIGDTKEWGKKTWHFCGCPNHRDGILWHVHPAAACCTRRKWLEAQGNEPPPADANLANDDDDAASTGADPDDTATTAKSSVTGPSANLGNVSSLLARSLELLGDNQAATIASPMPFRRCMMASETRATDLYTVSICGHPCS